MAGGIKGITVEIGGDTTKLSKALEGVNSQSRNLSGELGQVNRLLKLDPGNTELLAQKQKILADAITNTGKKLDTLKEAERQVQQQFERGEVSEEQVRALRREIIATEQKMKGYERAAKETEDALRGVGKETKEVEEASSALGANLADLAKQGFKAVVAAAGAAVTGLVACAEATRDYRMDMGKLDTAFTTNGFSAEAATAAYHELVGVLGESDQAVETANHLAKLTENEKDLATWTGDILPGVFATFGDSLPIEGLTEAANETAKVGQVTGPLADALNWAGVSEDAFNESLAACTTEQERQALITETLAGLYSEAADAYKETNAEVIRANQANDAWMASTAEIGKVIEPIVTDVKLLGASLVSDLVPGVSSLAGAVRELLAGNADAAGAVGDALSGIITDLLGKVTELAPTIVQVGVSLITSLTTTLISMLPQIMATVMQLFTTILDGVTQALPMITAAIVAAIPLFAQAVVTGVPQVWTAAVQLFMAIVQAIPQILPALIAELPRLVTSIVQALVAQIPTLLQGAITLLMAIVQAVPQIISLLVPEIPTIVSAVVQALIEAIPQLLAGAVQLFMAIVQAVPQIIVQLAKVMPNIILGIVTGLLNGLASVGAAALQIGQKLVSSVSEGAKDMGARVWSAISGALDRVQQWGADMVAKGKTAASNLLSNVSSTLSAMPGKVKSAIVGAVTSVVSWGTSMVAKAKAGMSNVVSSVVSTLGSLPGKVLSIGSDLVTGLWNGISDKTQWLIDKIGGFASSVMDKIRGFFGTHSPSTKTAWIGDMLDRGLAEGMLDNADKPIRAAQEVSTGVLDAAAGINGLSLDRQLQSNFSPSAGVTETGGGIAAKLDAILTAIERGQILTIDSDALVGATADKYDRRLGQQRALAARGAV